jgi:hypothetical protein
MSALRLVSTRPVGRWSARRLAGALSARFGPFKALACQQVSFSRFGLALVRATNRYQRQSGSALSAELRDDWLKC